MRKILALASSIFLSAFVVVGCHSKKQTEAAASCTVNIRYYDLSTQFYNPINRAFLLEHGLQLDNVRLNKVCVLLDAMRQEKQKQPIIGDTQYELRIAITDVQSGDQYFITSGLRVVNGNDVYTPSQEIVHAAVWQISQLVNSKSAP